MRRDEDRPAPDFPDEPTIPGVQNPLASETTRPEPPLGERGEAAAVILQYRLRVMSGPDAGKAFLSAGPRTVIGTHVSADVVLEDRSVSRFHCEILVEEGRVLLRDLGSRNGTEVNGVRVLHAYLREGACLGVGATQLRLEVGAESIRVPLSERERFGFLVGHSKAMRAVFAVLERAAKSEATVLVQGETGTGKEVTAASIHHESTRRGKPFVVVDCSAISPTLLESELFGHERGAFTGASEARAGAFESANGGTVFIDEIGELTEELQPKLLRVVEQREVKRVGSDKPRKIDVRIVAATNRDLKEEVNARRFRADLFYRFAVLEVHLPPLRDRKEDIPLLVQQILAGLDAGDDEAVALRTPEFVASLKRHPWPGNVRELRNYVERCLALNERPPLEAAGSAAKQEEAPREVRADASQPFRKARDQALERFEREYLAEILRVHDGNATAASKAAGLNRAYFYRLLWRYGLR